MKENKKVTFSYWILFGLHIEIVVFIKLLLLNISEHFYLFLVTIIFFQRIAFVYL